MIHSGGSDERFDATQYAFFGVDENQELELGGLDEDSNEGLEAAKGDNGSSTGRDEEISSRGDDVVGSFDEGVDSNTFDKLNSKDEAEAPAWLESRPTFRGKDEHAASSGLLVHGPSNIGYSAQAYPSETWGVGSHVLTPQRPVAGPYASMTVTASQQHMFPQPGRSHSQTSVLLSQAPGVLGQTNPVGPGIGRPIGPPYQLQPVVMPGPMPFGVKDQSSAQMPSNWPGPLPQKKPQVTLLPPQVVLQHEGLHAAFQSRSGRNRGLQGESEQGSSVLKPVPHGVGSVGSYTREVQHKTMLPPLPAWQSYQPPQDRGVPIQREHDSFDQNSWQQLRSKYMTVEEIENIVRIQWAATHSSDPYIDDYYHLALQAKFDPSAIAHGRRPFAPNNLRELPSHTRPLMEPHAFLQIKALGRVPFPSIRRPRPLLEMDPVNAGDVRGGGIEHLIAETKRMALQRPLEQEPMLAVRIAAEDGLCLLLDVDDIDRYLAVTRPPDGGMQLRRRRQLLLEGLAVSLNLSGNRETQYGKDAGPFDSYLGDNLMFLRLVSLSKGRKLVAKYLNLLLPGTELVTVVTMSIFRNLNYLFGGVLKDVNEIGVNAGLANAVAMCVSGLSLSPLSALLAAVVLSPEPPLRPIGNPAGDGATVVIRAVLERATVLLTHHNAAYQMQKKAGWQAAFDAFFSLLTSYCSKKYDSIIHTLVMSSSSDVGKASASATASMSKEIPVELLKACLPHTSEQQRRQLLEFTQRSIGMTGQQPPP